MKHLFAALLVAFFCSGTAQACGTELWAKKTLTDATLVNFTPNDTTVAWLRSQTAVVGVTRSAPVETSVWRVKASLVTYKIEADGDYHLVLSDQGKTMIAEIPAPECGGTRAGLFKLLRTQIDGIYGPASASKWANPPFLTTITISGVGFFDKLHGQRGVAPNGVELHPVLGVSP